MIYLHPASSTSPERIQAVQASTGMTAVINTDGRAILQPPLSFSGCQYTAALLPTAPGLPVRARTQASQISPADRDTSAVGVFYEES